MLDPEQNAAFRDLYLEAWNWVRFGEREMDGLYMSCCYMIYIYMFFFFAAIHVAEYANELLFFLGEGIVEAETYKIEASQDCTCFLFGLAAGTGTVFPST